MPERRLNKILGLILTEPTALPQPVHTGGLQQDPPPTTEKILAGIQTPHQTFEIVQLPARMLIKALNREQPSKVVLFVDQDVIPSVCDMMKTLINRRQQRMDGTAIRPAIYLTGDHRKIDDDCLSLAIQRGAIFFPASDSDLKELDCRGVIKRLAEQLGQRETEIADIQAQGVQPKLPVRCSSEPTDAVTTMSKDELEAIWNKDAKPTDEAKSPSS
ncbi:hypothetical protein K2X85_04240 [bacterium]|nr:hypothetical protein [bacterium]